MTLLTDPTTFRDAPEQDLIDTYAKLTQRRVTAKYIAATGRERFERELEMTLLAAKDAAGHAGVSKGEEPDPFKDVAEHLLQRPTTLPPEPLARPGAITAVRATFAGESRCSVHSDRGAVLRAVQEAPEHTLSITALRKALDFNPRGHVQKLIDKGHLEAVRAQ